MSFTSTFKAIADDPFGEALDFRVDIRADTAGGSNELVRLTDLEGALEVSPIIRRRERDVAIAEGQTWSARFAHDRLAFNPHSSQWPISDGSMILKAARVQVGFAVANEWATLAQGRVERTEVDAENGVTIEVFDPIMDLLRVSLVRDKAWTTVGWFSEIQPEKTAAGSSSYTNTGNPITIGPSPGSIVDQTFRITFTSATVFSLEHVEDAYTQTGLAIGSNQNILRSGTTNIGTILAAGWAGTFATGDTFLFYASKKYAAADLNPVIVLRELLVYGGVESFDVEAGTTQGLEYDSTHWDDVESRFTSVRVGGSFPLGTNVMDLIQGLLVGMNASIYPSVTGQVALFHFHPDDVGTGSVIITGDPSDPDVSVLAARRSEDRKDVVNRVRIAYKTLTALEDASIEKLDASPLVAQDMPLELESPWAWTPSQIEATVNNLLLRRKRPFPTFQVTGTLRKLSYHEIAALISLTEPELSESTTKMQVVELAVDPMNQVVELTAWTDPALLASYFHCGPSAVDGTDVIL